jgi:hypothetical protein
LHHCLDIFEININKTFNLFSDLNRLKWLQLTCRPLPHFAIA